jgi:hypothetical protein
MRRFLIVTSLMFLAACGGAPTDESVSEQPVSEQASATESAAPGQVQAESATPGPGSCGLLPPRECFCAQYKTAATCNASGACVWNYGCKPTYE